MKYAGKTSKLLTILQAFINVYGEEYSINKLFHGGRV